MVAALHQFKIIQLGQVGFLFGNRLNQNLIMVIAKHQDMRQLNGCIPTNAHTRRNTLNNRAFRCADRGGGAGRIVISIQIDHAHQSLADRAVFKGTLNINKRILIGFKNVLFQILRHRRVNERRMFRFLLGAELRLGENQIDRGGCALRILTDAFPIGRIGRKLIAGNNCPLFHGRNLGEQDISRHKSIHSINLPFKNFLGLLTNFIISKFPDFV